MAGIVKDALPHFAPSLISNLIENLAGRVPDFALRLDLGKASIPSVLYSINKSLGDEGKTQYQQWIDTSFASLSSDVQLEATRLGLHQGSLQAMDDERGFTNLINKLHANIKRQCSSGSTTT